MIYRTMLRLIGRPAWAAPAPGANPLRDMAADVATRNPAVEHTPPADLAALLTAHTGRIVLFDVREPREFAVSHLANAILVPPRARDSRTRVLEALACRPEAELAVFYCAVGVRSSALAGRLRSTSGRNGGKPTPRIINMAGGLFQWANEGRPLVDGQGATTAVHPFNRHWGQFLLHRPNAIS